MDIIISHTAALEVMRQPYFPKHLSTAEFCPLDIPNRMPSPTELEEAREACPQLRAVNGRVGVLVSSHDACHASEYAKPHIRSTPLPAGSLVELAPGIRCASPALLPVELAPRLDESELLLLMSELLGLYAVSDANEMGLVQRKSPLADPKQMRRVFSGLTGVRGVKLAKQAHAHAPVQAASPQEANLYIRATTSWAKGGYSLSDVVLNDPVELQRISEGIHTLKVRKPGLLMRRASEAEGMRGVRLDYMGAWHGEDAAVRRDTQRRNELLANGYNPYEIYKEHYDDFDYMDGLMDAIRSDLGLSHHAVTRERRRSEDRARFALWRELELVDMRSWTERDELR